MSFIVPKGSTFGILGQNGSGKSTLLSNLAVVLEPSGGSLQVRGRVSSRVYRTGKYLYVRIDQGPFKKVD
ncbi:MAG TPA: ATP-binding cassette domain-containing protein [Methanospirillum sp.]|nr:ATP-binding cassette domain-containing protein [Methanospirillum sp.]